MQRLRLALRMLMVALAMCCSFALSAVNVTFCVDMSQVTINPNGVHLAGNFQGWDPGLTLVPNAGSSIYCITLSLAANTTYEFKFINGNSWGDDEIVPSTCGVPNGLGGTNRQVVTGTSDIVLPTICFGQCTACGAVPDYFLNGSANYTGGNCYNITNATQWQNGTVWYSSQLDLINPFNLQFLLNLGTDDANGADGVVFVLQRLGTSAIGASGGGMGFGSFTQALGVEFDTFQNNEYNDPVFDHVGVQINGNVDHLNANAIAAPVQMSSTNADTEDGSDHVVQINWDPSTQTLSVYFDCVLRISTTYDLINDVFGGQSTVYWGFTGATGAQFNAQKVCLQPSAVQSTTVQICPGGSIQLNAGSSQSGVYDWIPASYLDNASIAQPIASPPITTMYQVTTTDLCSQPVTRNITVEVLSANPACLTLPVELLGFDAEIMDEELLLKWSTASEKDNDYFHVSYSTDGVNFSTLTKMECSGNSNILQQYSYLSKRLHQDAYYVLHQTDTDGSRHIYPQWLFVPGLSKSEFQCYPLFEGHFLIKGKTSAETIYLRQYNVLGQIMREQKLEGNGEISAEWFTDQSFGILCVTDNSGHLLLSTKLQ
jgi:hypothetical protein